MKLVTSAQMKALDRAAFEKHGIPSLTLMERAGRAVAETAYEFARSRRGSVVVICGRGNNGGDGLVAARHLIKRGLDVSVFLLSRPSELSADARANWENLVPLTTHLYEIIEFENFTVHHPVMVGASLIIDAVFGTGLTREITGQTALIIEYINSLRRPVLAVDIPSGLSADSGSPLGVCIRASKTITFALPKLGLAVGRSSEYVGKLAVADIGIPQQEIDECDTPYFVTDSLMMRNLFSLRKRESHKGSFGHVGIIAGSGGKLGAGYLASMAALRAGCGLVTYFLPQAAFDKFDSRYPEIMCEPVPDKGRGYFHSDGVKTLLEKLENIDVLALGPAIGTHEETRAFQRAVIGSVNKPIVIDADGLNNMDLGQIKRRTAATTLTPHPGEFSRLTGIDTDKVQKNRFDMAIKFAWENRISLVLKGYQSVTALSDGRAYINPTGNPAMASAGMGDALTGLIAGLSAQKIDAEMSAVAGVYIHGLAGDIAAGEIGDRGIVSSDVIKRIPKAIREIMQEQPV